MFVVLCEAEKQRLQQLLDKSLGQQKALQQENQDLQEEAAQALSFLLREQPPGAVGWLGSAWIAWPWDLAWAMEVSSMIA